MNYFKSNFFIAISKRDLYAYFTYISAFTFKKTFVQKDLYVKKIKSH